ncbi:thioredoxin-like protein [Lactarius quietus]|nr:thioredoxin-like protein [Lactarius quietus]
MNEVVVELARKYPTLLALHIEAETHSEIAESFDIESADLPLHPRTQGHTILGRISGADARGLTDAIAKHLNTGGIAPPPLSQTDKVPSTETTTATSPASETPEALEKRLRGLMSQSNVVLFMKGSPDVPRCGFSRKICALLKEQRVDFSHFDILTDESVRQGLKKLNDWPTFPQLIVKGELVGGLDIVQEMVETGEFVP